MPGMAIYPPLAEGLRRQDRCALPPAMAEASLGRGCAWRPLSSGRDEAGSVPGSSLARYGLVGVSRTTAGTPSGLMLKARKVNGSLPGLPHWCTRPKGS